MAQRFGGKYSPGGEDAPPPKSGYEGARADPAGARSNVMFVPAIPLVFISLGDGAIGLTLGLAAAGVLTLSAWLLREGLRAEAAWAGRKVARRPAFPRKMAASLLAGIGVGMAAFKYGLGEATGASDPALYLAPALFGLVTTGLHAVAFGIDPMRDKGMGGVDRFQQDRVARVVDEAEAALSDMSAAIARAGDRRLETRVEQFQATARKMFRRVEEDPRDLTQARKYMTVYLSGARDATVKFAELYARTRDAQARADYAALLDDLEENFAARTQKMLLDDRSDLTVEIEVLRERLHREGVRLD